MASLIDETRLLAQFDHRWLLKVYRFWRANGTAYRVMPLYKGVTLKERRCQLGGPADERWLLALLALPLLALLAALTDALTDALTEALTDALKIIDTEHCPHRDIGPDNILMAADSGRPLRLDVGAARQVIGDATQALTAIPMSGYTPVEQYAEVASLKQGPWIDVCALCAVMLDAMMASKPSVWVASTLVGQARCTAPACDQYGAARFQVEVVR